MRTLRGQAAVRRQSQARGWASRRARSECRNVTTTTGTAAEECVEFGPIMVRFDGRVLRPRPWTLAQSRWAAEAARTAPPGPILELCAGVGQIGLAAVVFTGRSL